MTLDEKLAAKRQIFNPREAFTMLSKELMDILRGTMPWLEADAISDDVYRWWDAFAYECCNECDHMHKSFWIQEQNAAS